MVQIFLAHSSKDDWLIDPISSILREISVEPYVAKLEDPTPLPLPQKLFNAIKNSTAMFVFLTHNVTDIKETRDIVNWEIATAHTMKKRVYVFTERGIEVPIMINYTTVYFTYDPLDQKSLDEMIEKMQKIAINFKENEEKGKAAVTLIALLLGIFILGSGSSS